MYSIAQRKSSRVTDGLTEVSEPVFDRNGRYLYVIASDQAGPVKDWFSLASLDITFTHSLYAIVLRKDDASPLPREGEIPAPATEATPAKEGEAAPAKVQVRIDFDGIGERIVAAADRRRDAAQPAGRQERRAVLPVDAGDGRDQGAEQLPPSSSASS